MDRRRICDGSEELRVLKERLHMAKVNKDGADCVYSAADKPLHPFLLTLIARSVPNSCWKSRPFEMNKGINGKISRENLMVAHCWYY